MTAVRVDYLGGEPDEMELIRFDAANSDRPGVPRGNSWILRESSGDVIAINADDGRQHIEVKCDFCGEWVEGHITPTPDDPERWRCYGGTGPCDATDGAYDEGGEG